MSSNSEGRDMPEKLTWDDAEKIAVLLSNKHSELYPL
jgi:hypothetical protein